MMGVNMSSSLILQWQCDTAGLPSYHHQSQDPVRLSSQLTADIQMQKPNILPAWWWREERGEIVIMQCSREEGWKHHGMWPAWPLTASGHVGSQGAGRRGEQSWSWSGGGREEGGVCAGESSVRGVTIP